MRSLWGGAEARNISYQDVWGKGLEWRPAKALSGVAVNQQSALGLSAVLRCVRLLSDTVSTLPMHGYRQLSDGQRMRLSPEPQIITAPSPRVPVEAWVQQAMVSLLLWGNAYGLVTSRDRMQVATGVEWVNPDSVTVTESSSLGRPEYRIGDDVIAGEDIVHIPAFLMPGSVKGAAPLELQRETVGLGLAAQRYGAEWFGSGGHLTGVLTTDLPVDEDQAKTIKDRFMTAVKGRGGKGVGVLGAGLKYQPVQVAAEESQFLETQQATVNDIARIFGVPAEMIGGGGSGGSLTYANREQSAIDFLTFSVNPWLVRLERALSTQLPRGQFVKFNPDALLRTDTKSRYDAHAIALQNHFMTIDEVRALEERAPLDVGEMFPPSNVTGQPATGEPEESEEESE